MAQIGSDWLNGFNTQPPEGGWEFVQFDKFDVGGFNTQPPEGGWVSSQTIT